MADVVVVGGGFAGIAAAVRIAKLRHRVTLLEESERLGGQLVPYESAGWSFDHGWSEVTLPATVRDLFKKSGRPVDRVLDLVALPVARRHVLARDMVLDLPTGSRGAQTDTIDAVLGSGAGERWTRWLDAFDEVWEVLRRHALEQRLVGRTSFTRDQWRTLSPRTGLERAARRALRDPSLRAMVLDRHRLNGQQPRALPAFLGVYDLVERSFGRWRIDGGTTALLAALERRLEERRVDVRLSTRAHDVVGASAVTGVVTDGGTIRADVVVWAAPGPPGGRQECGALPLVPAARTYLGLGPHAPRLVQQTVVHGGTPVRILPSATHAGDGQAWTVEHVGAEDPLVSMRRLGIDVEDHVVHREDVSAVDLVRGGARFGWQWSGWPTAFAVPGVGPLRPGYLRVGVNAHPGPSTELVALGAAAAAETLRP
ncbi:FAD-dependent oxidoreductase [Mumia sp. ZJ1417]|uniref:phytoene desaturase family protein n=1 Tax=Mumia sp. ZJ1417 TaxID=2708082 RepID=UPI00141D7C26|nr:FAD-dependent oxidoreductase [Mumia sp. ZJ1417]QMW67754.1 FAD-dependent oxidoreductase [Mumia sp. ZJ1417]